MSRRAAALLFLSALLVAAGFGAFSPDSQSDSLPAPTRSAEDLRAERVARLEARNALRDFPPDCIERFFADGAFRSRAAEANVSIMRECFDEMASDLAYELQYEMEDDREPFFGRY